jgi:Nuclear protein 96
MDGYDEEQEYEQYDQQQQQHQQQQQSAPERVGGSGAAYLPQQLGLNAMKLHLMKMSYFDDDDDEEDEDVQYNDEDDGRHGSYLQHRNDHEFIDGDMPIEDPFGNDTMDVGINHDVDTDADAAEFKHGDPDNIGDPDTQDDGDDYNDSDNISSRRRRQLPTPVAASILSPFRVPSPRKLPSMRQNVSAINGVDDNAPTDLAARGALAVGNTVLEACDALNSVPLAGVSMYRSFRVGWASCSRLIQIDGRTGDIVIRHLDPIPQTDQGDNDGTIEAEATITGGVVDDSMHASDPITATEFGDADADADATRTTTAVTSDLPRSKFIDLCESMLRAHLQHYSTHRTIGNDSSIAEAKRAAAHTISHLANSYESTSARLSSSYLSNRYDFARFNKSTWHLVRALWAPELGGPWTDTSAPHSDVLRLEDHNSGDTEMTSNDLQGSDASEPLFRQGSLDYTEAFARRTAITEWLQSSVTDEIRLAMRHLASSDIPSSSVFVHKALMLVSGHHIEEACEHAIECGDLRLATLLASLDTDGRFSALVRSQVTAWRKSGIWESHMDDEHRKLYETLAGLKFDLEDASWLRAFGMHFWYWTSPAAEAKLAQQQHPFNSSLATVLRHYDNTHQSDDAPVSYPVPPFQERERQRIQYSDIRYSLMRLYCDRRSNHLVLAPETSSSNLLDYQLLWFVMDLLQHTDALDNARTVDITMNFAAQLENMGLWHWAIYVVLSSRQYGDRVPLVNCDGVAREILFRNIPVCFDSQTASSSSGIKQHMFSVSFSPDTADEKHESSQSVSELMRFTDVEQFLVDDVGVPRIWVHEAKAARARYECLPHIEVPQLIAAEQWEEAHDVLVSKLAGKWILQQKHAKLFEYLDTLCEKLNRRDERWLLRGGVYYDYLDIIRQRTDVSSAELLPRVESLLSRFGQVQPNSNLERVALSNMSAEILQVHKLCTQPSIVAVDLPSVMKEDTRIGHMQNVCFEFLNAHSLPVV